MREDSRVDSRFGTSGTSAWAAGMPLRVQSFAARAVAGLMVALVLADLGVARPGRPLRFQAKSGFPLRFVAYVVHPVGVILDTLIFRPAHWVGSKEPLKTLFGHTGD